MALQLTVYVRSYCHLCEDMLHALNTLQTQWQFELNIIDIEGAPQLEEEYGVRIPVLKAGEEEICHYFLDQSALAKYIGTD